MHYKEGPYYFSDALDAVAVVAAIRRDGERAVGLRAVAANLRNLFGVTVQYAHGRKMAREINAVRARISSDAFDTA